MKPEVHIVVQSHGYSNVRKKLVKVGLVFLEIFSWTDTQTDRQTALLVTILCSRTEGGVKITISYCHMTNCESLR